MRLDPFWEARYGPRGRAFSAEDGSYHLRYLQEALASEMPILFVDYARWLRGVLVSRGMCTLHLMLHFERIALIMEEELGLIAASAQAVLARGIDSLEYSGGPEHLLIRHVDAIDAGAHRELAAPDGCPASLLDTTRRARFFVWYAADAIAQRRPTLWREHLRWLSGFYGDASRHRLAALLRAIDGELAALPENIGEARGLLGEALHLIEQAGQAA